MLAQLIAISIPAGCIAQTVTPRPDGSGVPATSPSAIAGPVSQSALQEVIISGNPSLLRVPNPWPWPWPRSESSPTCATFHVTATTQINTLDLYASGLGRTSLAETVTDTGADCPDTTKLRDRISLSKPSPATGIDQFVAIKVASDPLSTPGAFMQGSIIALAAGKKVAEFALKVERPPRDELWTAITWVMTVLIPAIMTFLIGQLVIKLAARQKESTDFRDYRLSSMVAIDEFFNKVDTVIRAKQHHPGDTIYKFVTNDNIASRMPKRGATKLFTACVADDLKSIVRILRGLFPEFKQSIAKLETSLRNLKQE